MKLVAIYNVWNDWDMLRHSLANVRPLVDGVIIIGSSHSNYKEFSPIPSDFHNDELFVREPHLNIPMHSETDKRNYGLKIARQQGYTHFLTIDSDEFYDPEPFLKAKELFKNTSLKGLVCKCQTYFNNSGLTMGLDTTLVPFIHELTPTIKHEFNRQYPFAWIDGQIRIDPTRSLNINSGVELIDLTMHHMSWVRADLEKKVRNSTARKNLENSTIVKDVLEAKHGSYIPFYKKTLYETQDLFGINSSVG